MHGDTKEMHQFNPDKTGQWHNRILCLSTHWTVVALQ